jgi:hypothetical protein
MLGTARNFLMAAALVAVVGGTASAQQTESLPTPPRPVGSVDPTPAAPAGSTLLAWPPPEYKLPPVPVPTTSLQVSDPLLVNPGHLDSDWFSSVEITAMGVHLRNRIGNTVMLSDGTTTVVHADSAPLNWTVEPLVEVGYRLPHGFGELLVNYRFLTTEGQADEVGGFGSFGGFTHLKSRLNTHAMDFSYAIRDPLGAYQNFATRWKVGLSLAQAFFDARSIEAIPVAAGGGSFEQHTSNTILGAGPEVGLELWWKRCGLPGLELYGQVNFESPWVRIHQKFETNTTPGTPGAAPVSGVSTDSRSDSVGILRTQLGLCWSPPQTHWCRFFLGYEFEAWWFIGRNDTTTIPGQAMSNGDLYEQGIFLRAEFNF